jgi:hypothetical protein
MIQKLQKKIGTKKKKYKFVRKVVFDAKTLASKHELLSQDKFLKKFTGHPSIFLQHLIFRLLDPKISFQYIVQFQNGIKSKMFVPF